MAEKLPELSTSCAQLTHSAGIPLAVAAFRRWARGPRLVEDEAGVSLMLPIRPAWRRNLRMCLQQHRFCACRGKTARVINYEEFKKALEELAPKRFKDKSKEEAYEAICQLVAGKEPINVGVTVSEEPLGRWEKEGRLGGEDRASRGTPWPWVCWGLRRSRGHGRVLSGCQGLAWCKGGRGVGHVLDSLCLSPLRRKPRRWGPWRG